MLKYFCIFFVFFFVVAESDNNSDEVRVYEAARQNGRDHDEDRVGYVSLVKNGTLVFAFDGHAGDYFSELAKKKLIPSLKDRLDRFQLNQFNESEECIEHNINGMVYDGFDDEGDVMLDEIRKFAEEAISEKHSEYSDCGSTYVIAIIRKEKILIANGGDSGAMILLKNGIGKQITTPHSINEVSEIERIHDVGGLIQLGYGENIMRLGGILIPTRGFGDAHAYQFGFTWIPDIFSIDPCTGKSTPVAYLGKYKPNVETTDDTEPIAAVGLLTDGVSDFLTPQEIAEIARENNMANDIADKILDAVNQKAKDEMVDKSQPLANDNASIVLAIIN